MAALARVRAGVAWGLEVAQFAVVEPLTCSLGAHKPIRVGTTHPRIMCLRCGEACGAR